MERSTLKKMVIALAIMTPASILVGGAFLEDHVRNVSRQNLSLVSGSVIVHDSVRVLGVARRPLVHIRVDGSQESVRAILLANTPPALSARVIFRWSGTPEEEVWLENETSPLVVALAFILLPLIALGIGCFELCRSMKRAS